MNFNQTIFTFLMFFLLNFIDAKLPELTTHTTYKKAEEILKNHVVYKQFTPEIAARTLKNYLEELDPMKTYFLQSEVSEWEYPTEEFLEKVVSDYKQQDFSTYEKIYQLMVHAIKRQNDLQNKLSQSRCAKDLKVLNFKEIDWAKDIEELENRLQTVLGLHMQTAEQLQIEPKDLFLQRVSKRRISREERILQKGKKKRQNQQMLVYFLKSFSSALDSHTVYFTPEEANQFMIDVQKRLFGIGAELCDDLTGFTLVRLLEGGPAHKKGLLRPGDKIVAVNREPVIGLDIIEAIDLIRGPKGTAVNLTILRELKEGEESKVENFDVEIIRDEVVLKETRFEVKRVPFGDGIIAYLHLFSFYEDPNHSSASDLKKALEEIKEHGPLLGVVFDLRDNAGGLLPQAVAVTGLFMKKGIVVSVKDSEGTIQHLRNYNGAPTWEGPLIVLTNKKSASAAEIVAQSLKDYGRALLVGDPYTWGKGSYQLFTLEGGNVNKISPQGEYKVTRGLYYTTSGKSPQLVGTKVDIEVPGTFSELAMGESFGKFPLKNDTISPNYIDTLSDIHPFHRGKILRLYKKDRQEKVDLYAPYLEILKKNSTFRIQENRNYQNFLEEMRTEEEKGLSKYGQNDLQLEETLHIMKDLILMDGLKKEPLPAASGG